MLCAHKILHLRKNKTKHLQLCAENYTKNARNNNRIDKAESGTYTESAEKLANSLFSRKKEKRTHEPHIIYNIKEYNI